MNEPRDPIDLRALRLDDAPGPARPLSPDAEDRLVEAVLRAAADASAPRPVAPVTPLAPARRRRPSTALLLLAAALALAAATALAAGWWARSSRPHAPPLDRAAPPGSASGESPASAGSSAPPAASEPPAGGASAGSRPAPAGSAEPATAAASSTPASSAPASGALASAAARSGHGAAAAPAVDLLQQANQLRAQRRWAEAERAYRQVAARFPGTPEAYTATIAAASIRLEHLGDPGAARDLYRRAEAAGPGGALAEEIDYGIADSYRASGDARAEASALRGFLRRHPDSLLRARAEARLRQVEATLAR